MLLWPIRKTCLELKFGSQSGRCSLWPAHACFMCTCVPSDICPSLSASLCLPIVLRWPGPRKTVCTEVQHVGSGPSLMWNRFPTTREGQAQLETMGAPAASGAAWSNRLPLFLFPRQLLFHGITASCTEKLTTGHAPLPHRWMGIHQYHA